jgi:hypothetical protein
VIFDLADTADPKGQLSYGEWKTEILKANPSFRESDLNYQFEEGDLDDDDYLSFEEYKRLVENAQKYIDLATNDPVRDVYNGADTTEPFG